MGHAQGSTVVGKRDGVEMQHPNRVLGNIGELREECGSLIPAALGSSGLTGPSGTTSTYPQMDRPRPERFSATAMATFYFFFLETSSSWHFPALSLFPCCSDHPAQSIGDHPLILASGGAI